jgi:hypothetical protein
MLLAALSFALIAWGRCTTLVSTVEEILQLRVLERILVEHLAVSVSQEVFGKASNVLIGDLREGLSQHSVAAH